MTPRGVCTRVSVLLRREGWRGCGVSARGDQRPPPIDINHLIGRFVEFNI